MRSIDEFEYDGSIRLWGIDYDGVLTNARLPSQNSIKGLEMIVDSGAEGLIVTGRSPINIQNIMQKQINVAGFNGALICLNGEIIHDSPLPQEFTDELGDHLVKNDHPALFYTRDAIFAIQPGSDWNSRYAEVMGLTFLEGRPERNAKCYMVEIQDPSNEMAGPVVDKVRLISQANGNKFQFYHFVPPIEGMETQGKWMQFSSPGGKLPAISLVTERLGVDMNSVACVGDGFNDEEMLMHPETVGVVMGQADELFRKLSGAEKEHLYRTNTYANDGFLYAVKKIHGGTE